MFVRPLYGSMCVWLIRVSVGRVGSLPCVRAAAACTRGSAVCAVPPGILERLGDVLTSLPELRSLLQQRETAVTDLDSYARKV